MSDYGIRVESRSSHVESVFRLWCLCPKSGRITVRLGTPGCEVRPGTSGYKVVYIPGLNRVDWSHDSTGSTWIQGPDEDLWVQDPVGGIWVLRYLSPMSRWGHSPVRGTCVRDPNRITWVRGWVRYRIGRGCLSPNSEWDQSLVDDTLVRSPVGVTYIRDLDGNLDPRSEWRRLG